MVRTANMRRTNRVDRHREYVESGRWKCAKSPTGAHHWIEPSSAEAPGAFYCKWCYEVKELPTTLQDAMRASGEVPQGQ